MRTWLLSQPRRPSVLLPHRRLVSILRPFVLLDDCARPITILIVRLALSLPRRRIQLAHRDHVQRWLPYRGAARSISAKTVRTDEQLPLQIG